MPADAVPAPPEPVGSTVAPASGPAVAHADLAGVHGVRESALPGAVAARLPPDAPGAPWTARFEAVVFWRPATRAARVQTDPALHDARALPLTVGALVRYLDTPVGAYSEVIVSPRLLLGRGGVLPAGHVPFIVVDSLASIVGGRANWALPKGLGRFAWPVPPGELGTLRGTLRASAVGEGDGEDGGGWSVAVTGRPRRPRIPFVVPARALQVTPHGELLDIPARVRGRVQHCLVTLRATGPTLPDWMPSGTWGGAVVSGASAWCGAPRPHTRPL